MDSSKNVSNINIFELILLALFLILNYNVYAEGVKVVNPAIPLQSQLNDNSTVYVFNSCYDLKGQVVVIPQGTVLKFEGGKLINGIIKNSSFYVEAPRIQIFEKILFFTIEDAGLQQLDPVRVKVLKDNSFFNIETDCIAKKGDIVNCRSLYRLSNPSCTSNAGNGLRKVTFNRTNYIVNDKWNNYTYPTRQMVGIDIRNGKMLQSTIIDAQNERFYQIIPLTYNNVTTLLNREVYAEWFGNKVNATDNQSNTLNYGISVATNSKAFFTISSGVYRIDTPLIATTNTKIQGVDSSPWNVCTNLSINTGKGIIAFDEKGCNNLLLEGLSFSPHSKEWTDKYTGVEIRTSIQGMNIKNYCCPIKIGID